MNSRERRGLRREFIRQKNLQEGTVDRFSPKELKVPKPMVQSTSKTKWSRKWFVLKVIGWLVMGLATSLGIITGYFALVSKVVITQTETLNPSDIFSAQFVISNEGPLPINSVTVSCELTRVIYEDPNMHFGWNGIDIPELSPRMKVGERATVPCPLGRFLKYNSPVVAADIPIYARFRPDFAWEHNVTYRFITMTDSTGHLHWYPKPSASK
jgi:hypothetical protein